MPRLPKSLRLPVVGLDISDRTFKFVKFRKEKKRFSIDFYGQGSIPDGVVVSGEIKDVEKLSYVLAQTLQSHLKKGPLPVAYSLPEERGFVRLVELPSVEEEEIKSVVRLQLEENFPLSPENTVFDYEILRMAGGQKHMDLVISAFPREIVESYMVSLQGAGLKPVIAETESQALARAVVPSYERGPVMIVDIGYTRTSFFIAHRGIVRFTSTVNFSGQELIRSIMMALGVDEKKAVRLKNEFSFFREDQRKIYEAITPSIDGLKDELKKRLLFWETHETEAPGRRNITVVERIYLTGGESHMVGLPEYLASVLNVSVERAQPWEGIFDLETYIPPISAHDALLYATAFGLALRHEL